MIGKIRKGRSFSGCIRYVTQKDDAKIIASEGVLLGTVEETARSFRWQCLLNPDVAKPVGHIALSFKPEDAPRLTDAFMARLAEEYLELMGIRNTQFIVVRHHGTDNPHCHIVFNRVNFDGKVISDSNDFKRNEKVTKMLKDKYSLTYSEGKQSVKTEKLHASEKVKYEIYRAVKEALRSADTWKEFQNKLLKMGVEMEFKYKENTNEVQGIRFIKNGLSFKGSGIDRSFSWSRLDAALDHNHVTSLENDVSQKQPYHEQSHGSVIDNLVEVTGTGGVFMPSVAPTEDEKEAERLQSAVEKNGLEIAAVRNHTVRLSEGWPLSAETFAGEMEKIRYCLSQDCQAVKETVRRLDERMVLLKKEPERRLVTYRLESASKAVVTTASALILALIISVWTNCNQYRTNRLLKDADLKYRAIRICLPGDDPDIAFLEKHFTIKRDEEKIRRVERLVTAFEDSVRNRIRNHEMAAYKDSLAHRLFREAQEIRKQLDNPNSK